MIQVSRQELVLHEDEPEDPSYISSPPPQMIDANKQSESVEELFGSHEGRKKTNFARNLEATKTVPKEGISTRHIPAVQTETAEDTGDVIEFHGMQMDHGKGP